MIVCDNACKLHRYVLRRAPQFFSSTLFRIDRLYIRNHDGCSSGYDLRQYPASMLVSQVTLGQLNTQGAEQVNALLEDVRTQVAYMKHDNAITTHKVKCTVNQWT
ncbi:TPA: hypothetical protein ACH3X2_010544 [Trebouxia sp. C0005]